MDGRLIRLARTGLSWGVRELAAASDVAASTIMRIEKGGGAQTRTIAKLRAALEEQGVVFLAEDADGRPGLRLPSLERKTRRRRPPSKP